MSFVGKTACLALAALPFVVAPAVAQTVENYQQAALTSGRYAAALAPLEAAVAADPTDPAALVNLALVYRQTGRASEANTLYERVLRLDDEMLDVAGGKAMSAHAIARAKLRATAIAQR